MNVADCFDFFSVQAIGERGLFGSSGRREGARLDKVINWVELNSIIPMQ